MSLLRSLMIVLVACFGLTAQAQTTVPGGQGFGAVARVLMDETGQRGTWGGAEVSLGMSQAVPFRVHTLDNPRRIVMDFRDVDFASVPFADLEAALVDGGRITGLRAGPFRQGWSRLVLSIAEPLTIDTVALQTRDGDAAVQLNVVLERVTGPEFAAATGPILSNLFRTEEAFATDPDGTADQAGGNRLRILLDPGHGGIDPGAIVGDTEEADIVLAFAREARDILRRRGHDVALSRGDDTFVSLEGRIAAARHFRADIFISIHADSLEVGRANGAQIYTLAETASSQASRLLAERHRRDDLLSGVDLEATDDAVATALMEIARRETAPRTDALADALVDAFRANGVQLHKSPRESGAFAVLKAPDMPALLLELGFMSSPDDLARLQDPAWRSNTARAVAVGIEDWLSRDATLKALRRR